MKCNTALFFTFVYLASAVPNPFPIPPPFCDDVCDGDPSKQAECQKCRARGMSNGPGGRPPSVPIIDRTSVTGSLSARQNPEPQCKNLCDALGRDERQRRFGPGEVGLNAMQKCSQCVEACKQSYPRRGGTIQLFPQTCLWDNDWIRERAKACSTNVEEGELQDCTVKSEAPSPV